MRNILVLGFVLIWLYGCGGGSSSTTATTKDLFSSWAQDNSTFVLNLNGGSFGSFPFTYIVTGNAVCGCTLSVGGTESSGNAVMTSCSYQTGTGGGSDPGCVTLEASYTYSKTATVLTICQGGACNTYH